MGDTHHDPTDHSRTTQPHAGIAMKDNFFWPGLILLAVAVFGLISTAAAAAYRHYEWLATTLLIAVLGTVAGALWLVVEHRRVTRIDEQLVRRTPRQSAAAELGVASVPPTGVQRPRARWQLARCPQSEAPQVVSTAD